MWPALRQVFKDTTVYYNKLAFFLIVVAAGASGYGLVTQLKTNTPQASSTLPSILAPSRNSGSYKYAITIDRTGKVMVNDRVVRGTLSFEKDRTTFLLILAREVPTYVDSIDATITLPKPFQSVSEFDPQFYTLRGIGASSYRPVDQRSIRFEAYDIYEGAELSIRLTFPRNYFELSFLSRVRSQLVTLAPEDWLLLGILIPGFSLLYLGYLMVLRWSTNWRRHVPSAQRTPPNELPPAIVGALYHGHIGKREITATLVDLAERGYLTIHHTEDNHVAFAKGTHLFSPKAANLRPFEIFLLHQIFGDGTFVTKTATIQHDLDQELFSRRVAQAMINIYDAALAEGYFIESPNRYYLKHKVIGMIMFFVALLALVYGAFTLPEPAYTLFFWVGMIAASLLIIWITPGLPHRTRHGDAALQQWLGFRAYLTDRRVIHSLDTAEFFKFLPYAIVLDCEHEWIYRWRESALALPDWFSATVTPYTPQDYEASLLFVVNNLARELFGARTPDLA